MHRRLPQLLAAPLLALCAGCGGPEPAVESADLFTPVGTNIDPSRLVEVDLGEFKLIHMQDDHSTVIIEFRLVALAARQNERRLTLALESHSKRIHDAVATLIKESEPENLLDPRLGLLKSGLRRVINQQIRQVLVEEVVFSQFSHEVHR